MTEGVFRLLLAFLAVLFTAFFCLVVLPPLIEHPDIPGAFAAGFVNPYASGYSMDVLVCWLILSVWVLFDAKRYGVTKGWICLVLGIVPGVAVGFAAYLLLRTSQLGQGHATQC